MHRNEKSKKITKNLKTKIRKVCCCTPFFDLINVGRKSRHTAIYGLYIFLIINGRKSRDFSQGWLTKYIVLPNRGVSFLTFFSLPLRKNCRPLMLSKTYYTNVLARVNRLSIYQINTAIYKRNDTPLFGSIIFLLELLSEIFGNLCKKSMYINRFINFTISFFINIFIFNYN